MAVERARELRRSGALLPAAALRVAARRGARRRRRPGSRLHAAEVGGALSAPARRRLRLRLRAAPGREARAPRARVPRRGLQRRVPARARGSVPRRAGRLRGRGAVARRARCRSAGDRRRFGRRESRRDDARAATRPPRLYGLPRGGAYLRRLRPRVAALRRHRRPVADAGGVDGADRGVRRRGAAHGPRPLAGTCRSRRSARCAVCRRLARPARAGLGAHGRALAQRRQLAPSS